MAGRAAHWARVWTALGYGGWAAYASKEFGVSRSTADRLLDLAAAAEAIEDVVGWKVHPYMASGAWWGLLRWRPGVGRRGGVGAGLCAR